jgi:hypothetical protein
MADAHQLKIIEQGTEVWNRWRDSHPDIKPDLSQAYLYEAELSGANLSHANLSRACLIGANLKDANLKGADLQSAYVSAAHLTAADLSEADLRTANFSEANLADANFYQALAIGTNFTSATLTGACLEGWQIDTGTLFEATVCHYFYWRQQQKDRFPPVGEFTFTDFNQLIQSHLNISPDIKNHAAAVASQLLPPSLEDAIADFAQEQHLPKTDDDLAASLVRVPRQPKVPALLDLPHPQASTQQKVKSSPQGSLTLNQTGRLSSQRSLQQLPAKSAGNLAHTRSAVALASDPTPSQTITVKTISETPNYQFSSHQLAALPQSPFLTAVTQAESEADSAGRWFITALAYVGVGAAIALLILWASSQWSSKPAISPALQQHRVERNSAIF